MSFPNDLEDPASIQGTAGAAKWAWGHQQRPASISPAAACARCSSGRTCAAAFGRRSLGHERNQTTQDNKGKSFAATRKKPKGKPEGLFAIKNRREHRKLLSFFALKNRREHRVLLRWVNSLWASECYMDGSILKQSTACC